MKKILALFPVAFYVLCSCHTPRHIVQAPIPKKDTVAVVETIPSDKARKDSVLFMQDTYRKILANKIDFTSFSAKVDVDYEDGEGKKYNVNAHLRMKKDSVIWITITGALGIEGLRLLINKDSVRILDKQNKVYIPRSIPFLQELIELPLDLHTLQELLIGNPVFLDPRILSYTRSDNSITLQSNGDVFKNLFTISSKDYLAQTSKLDDIDPQENRTCFLTYSDYEDKKGVFFPTKRKILASEKKKINIKLDFKQYEFNEKLSFPFTVPKNYDTN